MKVAWPGRSGRTEWARQFKRERTILDAMKAARQQSDLTTVRPWAARGEITCI